MKARFIGWLGATIIRGIGLTLRFRVDDRAGIIEAPPEGPMIWAFWHNRLFVVPLAWRRYVPQRHGAVLTSASKDGEILAAALRCFGADSVRGSSSRRGSAALLQLVDWVQRGKDVAITPDGPRGPRCRLQPGIIKLAEKTGAPILPVRVEYTKARELKTWDGFRIPYPFSRVDVVFEKLQTIEETTSDEAFEAERREIEGLLGGEGPDESTTKS